MPSIFDSLVDTTEAPAPAKTGSIFDSLEGPQAAIAPTTSARPGEIPRDTSLKAPPAASGDASTLGKLVRGQGVLETGADAADIVLGGLPAIILGSIGEVTQRASSIFDGRGYREGAKAGAEFSRSMGEKFGRPIFDNLVATGLLNKETRSVPMQAMDKIGGYLEHAATVVEADTKGVISKEDYLASINGFMAAMGVKGAAAMTQGALNKAKARGTKSAWDTALERMDAEEQLARAKFEEGSPNRTAAKAAAERPADDGLYGGDFAQQAAARREAYLRRKAYEKGVANFPPSGERTGSRGPVELNLEGKETPTTYSGNQPFSTADQTAALKRGVVSPSPIETEGALRPAARPALDTGLEKVKSGRLFDMTMEERLAVKNSVDITDPKVITAAAVGATGLGLAMAYEPSAEEAVLAIGAGALLRRGGEGLPMRELLAKPEATPLGALLEASAYTTSTLEKLAEQSPGKFEFKKSAVEQLLKREGVTKHERELMTAAMAEVPRDTVTAKELMVGLKLATKDFELTPKKSDSYANYGLERIDRDKTQSNVFEYYSPDELTVEPNLNGDRWIISAPGFEAGRSFPMSEVPTAAEALRLVREDFKPQEREVSTTRIYRSPLELGSNNHFQDPNYFAHTRSFTEDGIRHVVELQSDLAQKAGKVLTPENRAQFEAEVGKIEEDLTKLRAVLKVEANLSMKDFRQQLLDLPTHLQTAIGTAINDATGVRRANALEADGVWIKRGLKNVAEDLAVRHAEISAKLVKEDPLASVAPMLKDWHKRLVREELADAARNLEPSVRFATADTVAKVEGWSQLLAKEDVTPVDSPTIHEDFMRASLKGYKKRITEAAGTDPEAIAKIPRQMATAEANIKKTWEKFGKVFKFPEHAGLYLGYANEVTSFLRQLGGKPYTDSAGHTWLEVPLGEQQKALPGGGARTQIGGVDPQLAKAVGLVGGSAALAAWLSRDKDKVKHAGMTALLTGLGLLVHSRVPAVAKMVTDTIDGVQNLVGNLSTDKAVSAPLLRRLTSHAEEEMRGVHDSGKRIAPFLEIVDRLPEAVKRDLDAALSNGRTSDIVAAVGKAATPGLLKAWNEVQAELKSLGNKLIEVKGLKELRPDYFPRIVKDLPGLMNAIGKEFSTPLQQALAEAERKAGGFLDETGRAQVVNTFIEKNLRASTVEGKPSFFKRRTLGDVTVDLAPYYVEPSQALPLYIGSAVRAIEKAKFFGKELVRDDGGRPNLEASIGNIVAREIEAGNITPENFTRLTDLLRTRFGPAYQSPARGLQSLSQATNIALLGNVFSGLMNVADIGAIAAQHGALPLVAAVTKMVRGTAKLKAADVGMAEAIGAEFVYGTRDPIKLRIPLTERTVQISLAKALDKTFKLSGFKALDTVMKEVNLNAAMEKYSRLARTKPGEARILRQYGDYFTTDMPQLLADLRAGLKTRLTTELAFRELSDAQPTTKIEMPKFYLDHPNLRFGYALKSFMIKQMNFVKKRGIDEMRKGNVVEGGGFIVRYALMAGAAGATMDWIVKSLLGRDADLDWKSIPLNALKNLGLSEYVIDKARQGKGKEAILAATVPPADPILNIVTADPQAVRYFPLVGRLVYDRFMDGAEKANAAKKLAEKKKAADARRTPEERRALEQRALERRKELVRER